MAVQKLYQKVWEPGLTHQWARCFDVVLYSSLAVYGRVCQRMAANPELCVLLYSRTIEVTHEVSRECIRAPQ